jgi:hypothetical protein
VPFFTTSSSSNLLAIRQPLSTAYTAQKLP